VALRQLGVSLDRRLLLVRAGESVWAWFGGRRRAEIEQVLELAGSRLPAEIALAVGEPARGVSGWRLTHQQAMAALPIAIRGPQRLVRYADVALLSSALRDNVLVRSLRDIYLAPLEEERDGGAVLRETLSVYFAASRNASSAAAALGVSRNTVGVRLRTIEERIGHTVDECAADLETALRLLDLTPR
jgi:DNA-binding PucR family transcriptional regulator